VGFGLGLISVPLLTLINPRFIPAPLLMAALVLNLLIFHRELHHAEFKTVGWAVCGRLAGAVIGGSILKIIPANYLNFLFGTMVIIAVVLTSIKLKIPPASKNILLAGTASGVMGTTSSIGGAPLAIIFQNEQGPRIRATLSVIFIFGTILSLLTLLFIGRLGVTEIILTLQLLPGVLLGFLLSKKTAAALDRGFIRLAILLVSGVSGLLVILKTFFIHL
jgi:hypothetical protein